MVNPDLVAEVSANLQVAIAAWKTKDPAIAGELLLTLQTVRACVKTQ